MEDLTKKLESKRIKFYLLRLSSLIGEQKKSREETQEGILEMIKIMNERMKTDLTQERKEREANEEVLIDLLETTCNRLQQSTTRY